MVRQMLSALKVGNKDGEREEEIGRQRKRLRVTAIVNFVTTHCILVARFILPAKLLIISYVVK